MSILDHIESFLDSSDGDDSDVVNLPNTRYNPQSLREEFSYTDGGEQPRVYESPFTSFKSGSDSIQYDESQQIKQILPFEQPYKDNQSNYYSQNRKAPKYNLKNHTDNFQANRVERNISTSILPTKLRSVFSFQNFNRMQSESFNHVYKSDNNCVVSAPTGSGKTVLFELAILRLFGMDNNCAEMNTWKVLYLAPTKALCSEKYESWKQIFDGLDISVVVLTGDTTFLEADNVKKSNIIVSTPEKWDLLTRRWADYEKLFSLVRLLLVDEIHILIDEIHILKDARGSTLEVLITRMKKFCPNVRILALSATVPNVTDISQWLKLKNNSTHPSIALSFNDGYRAVELERIVYGFKPQTENDFQFDYLLNSKLIEIIRDSSLGKSVLIFCPTRSSATNTAKYLYTNYEGVFGRVSKSFDKYKNKDLGKYATKGICFHHAGISYDDRRVVEKEFLDGHIGVLCSTTTLAIGINLPAYLVIIKGTKCWLNGGFTEYAETDILQMVGRAGRPQFETKGVAVILTTLKEKQKYERLVNGNEKIESSLHLNFEENLVAEISLGTIKSIDDALTWIRSTFFYVRFIANPAYYLTVPVVSNSDNLSQRLENFCKDKLNLLLQEQMILSSVETYKCTPYGTAMSKHYILFNSMCSIIRTTKFQTVRELLLLISHCDEFKDSKLRASEKKLFREINSSPFIRFPIEKDDFKNEAKIMLLIQYELGSVEYPTYNGALKHHPTFLSDKMYVFKQVPRILRAMIDVFIARKDYISLVGCMNLSRCIQGKCWEGSTSELKQISGVGSAYIKKFEKHNVNSLEKARKLTSSQIEYYLGLKIGGSSKICASLKSLPELRLSVTLLGTDVREGNSAVVNLSISISVENAKQSSTLKGKYQILNVVSGISTGQLVDFRRIAISKLQDGESKSFTLSISVNNHNSSIVTSISSENIAGIIANSSISLRTLFANNELLSQEFEDNDEVGQSESWNTERDLVITSYTASDNKSSITKIKEESVVTEEVDIVQQDKRRYLPNGNYECNHACKDKGSCRHYCCKQGIPVQVPKLKRQRANSDIKPKDLNIVKEANIAIKSSMSSSENNDKGNTVLEDVSLKKSSEIHLVRRPPKMIKLSAVRSKSIFEDYDSDPFADNHDLFQSANSVPISKRVLPDSRPPPVPMSVNVPIPERVPAKVFTIQNRTLDSVIQKSSKLEPEVSCSAINKLTLPEIQSDTSDSVRLLLDSDVEFQY